MSGHIDKLVLDCFRGASGPLEIEFDKGKAFTLIFGENGTGKSTIADAIDFVANQSFGSLQDRSLGSLRHPFVATLDRDTKDCKVEVSVGTHKWNASLNKQKVIVSGIPPSLRAMVLRRAQLLKLVEAEPAKRYEELQRFIDVGRIENAEQQLRDTIRTSDAALSQAVAVLDESQTALQQLWEKEGKPGSSADEWGRKQASRSISDLENEQRTCTSLLRLLGEVETKRTMLHNGSNLLRKSTENLDGILKKIATLSKTGAQIAPLVKLLLSAKAIVAPNRHPATCPLCEQSVDVAELAASIESRLKALEETTQLLREQQTANVNHQAAINVQASAKTQFVDAVKEAARQLKSLGGDLAGIDPASLSPFEKWLVPNGQPLNETEATALADVLLKVQPILERTVLSLREDTGKQKAISVNLDRLTKNTEIAKSLHELIGRMKRALVIVETARKEFAQGVLDEVSNEASRLYAIMHPGESLGALRLLMSPNKKGSIDQEATFSGKAGVPPQAYFSESHLDTLGFCVWLAVAKRIEPKQVVIVLDDIFTSVDNVHLTRIMKLLDAVAGEFAQLIALTHYRTWRDRYRLNQGPGSNVQLLELHRWTLARGVRLSGTLTGVEELEATLVSEPLNRQAISSQAGILLESILDRLSIQYRRRLPRNRESEWTLGDLLSGCKKLLSVIKVEQDAMASGGTASSSSVTTEVQPFLDDTGPLIFIRNQVGCHFNPIGAEVSDGDVEAFGKATVALVRGLLCKSCGDVPDRRDGTHFRCGCKKAKMVPLEYDK